ncbi:MAG: MerR family transcriptional regulator [Deltaproteobacteria bacterium]|nr:MerR family transcriptional regulator [Deltaproteobacteria bacterium]
MKQPVAIPNKLYFRIGEVADLLTVKPYVLRYWETEFPDIRPAKSKSGQRLYKRRDVETLVQIKSLLYGERFTINGARRRLKEVLREQRGGGDHASQIALSLPQEAAPPPAPVKVKAVPRPEKTPPPSPKILSKIKKDLQGLLDTLKV